MEKHEKADLIKLIIAAGFVISVFYHYAMSSYAKFNYYPYNTFLFIPKDKFNDFYNIFRATRDLNPYSSPLSVYFPFAYLLMYVLSMATFFVRQLAFAVFVYIFARFAVLYVYRNMPQTDGYNKMLSAFIYTFMSYPFLFTLDRGNLEAFLFIFLVLFFEFYQRDKFWLSSLFLSFAIAMKLYPILFLVLFLIKKRYRETFVTVGLVAILTLLPLFIFKGGFVANLNIVLAGSNIGSNPVFSLFLDNNNFILRSLSLFTFIKVVLYEMNSIDIVNMAVFSKVYSAAGALLIALSMAYVLFVEKELWKQAAIVVFAMLLFPHVSGDYKLIHVFIPLVLFINHGMKSSADKYYAVLFALLLIPKDYYIFTNLVSDSGASDISLSVLLNPLIMMLLSAGIIVSGLRGASLAEVRRTIASFKPALFRRG